MADDLSIKHAKKSQELQSDVRFHLRAAHPRHLLMVHDHFISIYLYLYISVSDFQLVYKANTEQMMHQYTMKNDEPLFLQAKANADLLSGVRPVMHIPLLYLEYVLLPFCLFTAHVRWLWMYFSRKCTRATGRSREKKALSCVWTLSLSSPPEPRGTWPVTWVIQMKSSVSIRLEQERRTFIFNAIRYFLLLNWNFAV